MCVCVCVCVCERERERERVCVCGRWQGRELGDSSIAVSSNGIDDTIAKKI